MRRLRFAALGRRRRREYSVTPRQSARRRPVPASTPSFRGVFHQFGAAQADDFFCILDGARDVVKTHDWYDLDSLPQAREVDLAYVIGASSNITNALLTYCVPMQIAHGLGVRSPSLLLFSVLVRVSLAEEDEPATHPRLLARMVGRVDLCGNQNIYDAFVLNHIVVLHAIDATPARWRDDADSSPLDGTSAATPSLRNDLLITSARTKKSGTRRRGRSRRFRSAQEKGWLCAL